MTSEQIKLEVNHIFEGGANEIRVINLIESVVGKYEKAKAEKTYTLEEMRDCFEQSRLTHPMAGFKHDTFEDYLSTFQ